MPSRSQSQSSRGKSKRGFAAMDPEQQRRIASKGGRASHGGRSSSSRSSSDYDDYDEYDDNDEDYGSSRRSSGRQGFASMDPDEQRRIASMGGRASHGGGRGRSRYDDDDNYSDDYNDDYDDDRGSSRRSSGRQGFASMDPDEQRRIASMGGRASHGGGRGRSRYDDDDNYSNDYDDDDDYSYSRRSSSGSRGSHASSYGRSSRGSNSGRSRR